MLKLLLGDPNARKLKRYQPIVSDINLLEEDISPLSDEPLRARRQPSRSGWRLQAASRISDRSSMRSCRRPLQWCVRPVSVCSACATSMCS